jgi:hypothetical protein
VAMAPGEAAGARTASNSAYRLLEPQGHHRAQDTFYAGNTKGVGRIYQQTFIDT